MQGLVRDILLDLKKERLGGTRSSSVFHDLSASPSVVPLSIEVNTPATVTPLVLANISPSNSVAFPASYASPKHLPTSPGHSPQQASLPIAAIIPYEPLPSSNVVTVSSPEHSVSKRPFVFSSEAPASLG